MHQGETAMGRGVVDRVRILVVEDSEDQGDLLRHYFEKAGCDVTLVASAEQAITAYGIEHHDLAVIDLQLPGMDGWQLTTKLKSERPACAIAITSVLDAADFPTADATLPKPFTGAQVRQVLMSTVSRWALQ